MDQSQFSQYLAVLMLFVLAVAAPGGMIVLSHLLGKRGQRSAIKDTAYECGMIPVGQGSSRLSVRFYLVAMLFILFDIEVVFLYPWAEHVPINHRPRIQKHHFNVEQDEQHRDEVEPHGKP